MELEFVIAGLLLLLMLFLATVDAAFSNISDVGLRRLSSDDDAESNERSIRFLREILDNRPRFRFALSATIQVLLVSFVVLLTNLISVIEASRLFVLWEAILIGVVTTVIFRQVIPQLIVRNEPEKKLLFLLPAIKPIYAIASLVLDPFSRRSKAREQQRLESTTTPEATEEKDDDNTEDFQALMEVGEAEGIIEESEREMIESFVEFSETRTGEIMTPRTDICAIPADASIRTARDLIIEEKYSRLPVYRDSIDNIVGMIYVRDLLAALANGNQDEPVETIVRDPYFVPETKTASELLKAMQADHVQIAVVIDEYGGVAGLVTLEDILEEIVGEIEDEDSEEEEIIEIIDRGNGYWDVIGSTEIDKIERIFGLDLEDEDYSTIAGLVVTRLGHVPKIGERLTLDGMEIEILEADEKRLTLLRISNENDKGQADGSAVSQ